MGLKKTTETTWWDIYLLGTGSKQFLKKIVSIKMNSHIQFSNFTAFSI